MAKLIARQKLPYQLFSNLKAAPWEVLLIDRMGVLASMYPLADVVFVGGSMVRHGGQNPIEPASEKKTVLHGPYVFNFQDVYEILDKQGAAFEVRSENELFEHACLLFQERNIRNQMGGRAFTAVESMKGATGRTLERIENWVSDHEPSTLARV